LGHELGGSADPTLEFALALDPIARRYDSLNWSVKYPALAKWNPQCRYEKTGHRKKADIGAVVKEARSAVTGIVAALWADGRLEGKSLYNDF
jgi:hypothetical protein